jgi:hypothetical protein
MVSRRQVIALALTTIESMPCLAAPQPEVFELARDHMVDHPAGGHSVLWNGPAFLDVGTPTGGFVRLPVTNLPPQWTLLLDSQRRPLPVAVLYMPGRGMAIRWLPYAGPPKANGTLTDKDYVDVLQSLSTTRYQTLMGTARMR